MKSPAFILSALLLGTSACATPPAPTAHPTEPGPTLFAAAAFTKAQRNSSIPTDAGVFLRGADGEWTPFGPKIQQVNSATVAPADPRLIFVAAGNGVIRSRDGGITWRQVTGWEVNDVLVIASDPTDADRVYAATAWGLWRSADGGETWDRPRTGFHRDHAFMRTLVLDPHQPGRLLAGTAGGIYETRNHGDTWQRHADLPEVNVLRLRRGEAQPAVWLAGTEGRGVWLSSDDGASWQATAPALATANVYGVAVDPTDARRLAAGGWQTGVHLSTDGGVTWQARTEGLPSLNFLTLAYDPNVPGRLWASAFEEGTVYSDDDGLTWQDGGLYGALVNDFGFLPLPAAR
jgi:photosystem II stability/assembly factor-like uncharacterized protein